MFKKIILEKNCQLFLLREKYKFNDDGMFDKHILLKKIGIQYLSLVPTKVRLMNQRLSERLTK